MNLMKQTQHQMRVGLFTAKMKNDKQPTPVIPTEPTKDVRVLRAKLMLEECFETIRDGLGVSMRINVGGVEHELNFEEVCFATDRKFNMVETADGLADCSVVNIGTAVACGIGMKPIQEIVDCNNMEKFGPGHSFNDAGKLIKPPDHKPPTEDIIRELASQGWVEPF